MEKLLRKPNIWDLHIHTPLGTPTKRNYDGISSEDFVDEILKIYNKSENKIGMISFTDHNKINDKVYKIFRTKSDITVIPGIEMDVYLSEGAKSSKHIIFYFPEKELDDIDGLKDLIEGFICSRTKVYFEEFVLHLMSQKKKFAVSPHAFKQGKRAIDFEWINEGVARKGTTQFSGLFFPFWEAGGKSDICKAIEFLENQSGEENTQSIIAFSDSADFIKIQQYIENPHQYFLCLNSFQGLLLAGSDTSRIIYEYEDRPTCNPSEKIKSITIADDLKPINDGNSLTLEFSDRLNVIIGGRGKGKSALLGAIVAGINELKIDDRSKRGFAKKFQCKVVSFKDSEILKDTNFLYFSQSYINKLFDNDNQDRLENYFIDQFSKNMIMTNRALDIKAEIGKKVNGRKKEDLNVGDDLRKIVYLKKKKADLKVRDTTYSLIDLQKEGKGYDKVIKKMLPNDKEIWDEKLQDSFDDFIKILLQNIVKANYERKLRCDFANSIKNYIDVKKAERGQKDKEKVEGRKRIEKKLRFLFSKELERARQINKLYEIGQERTKLDIKYHVCDGEDENKFYFVSVSNMEHPVEYARRIILESINRTKNKGLEKKSISEIFRFYSFENDLQDKIKDSISYMDVIM